MTLLRKTILLSALLSSVGCVAARDCDWAKPIRPTADDIAAVSDGLARDILTHNLTGEKLCGWKP
jgi:hypothetical protein